MAARESFGDPVPEAAVDEQAMDEDDRVALAEVAIGDLALCEGDGRAVREGLHRDPFGR